MPLRCGGVSGVALGRTGVSLVHPSIFTDTASIWLFGIDYGSWLPSEALGMAINSPLQRSILEGFSLLLRPLVRFLLRSGVGFREFSQVSKEVFVAVATEEFGSDRRGASLSRVAAITGISRKEVGKLRETVHSQNKDIPWILDLNPPSEVLHYWRYDSTFQDCGGSPKALPFTGEVSFSELVKRYAGDLPPSAIRSVLLRTGAIYQDEAGFLNLRKSWFVPDSVDASFVNSMIFSLRNLADTLVRNAEISEHPKKSGKEGRLERYVWTTKISDHDARDFKLLVEAKASEFLDQLDTWIGTKEQELFQKQQERGDTALESSTRKRRGIGLYYFDSNEDR